MQNKVRVNTAKDYSHLLLHTAIATGVCLCITAYAASWPITLAALGIMTWTHAQLMPKVQKYLKQSLPVLDPDNAPPGAVRLKNRLGELAAILRLKDVPDFHVLNKAEPDKAPEPETGEAPAKDAAKTKVKKGLADQFNKYANAFAYGTENKGVAVSRPLIEKLSPAEQDAVIAHELGHVAANHTKKRLALNFICGTASLTATFNTLATVCTSWEGVGIVVGSAIASGIAVRSLTRKPETEKGAEEKPEKKKSKPPTVKFAEKSLSLGILSAACLYTGRVDILSAVIASQLTKQANALTKASLSRRNEFQADRIAAEVTGTPLALKTGLNAVKDFNIAIDPEKHANLDYKTGTLLEQAFKRALTLYRSHPNTDRRGARLERMQAALS